MLPVESMGDPTRTTPADCYAAPARESSISLRFSGTMHDRRARRATLPRWRAVSVRPGRRDQRPAAEKPACTITREKHGRWREVRDPDELVGLAVYRKGAREVVRRLAA